MTEQSGTQGPQWPLPDESGTGAPVSGQSDESKGADDNKDAEGGRIDPPVRPPGDRTVVFGAPQLGGSTPGTPPAPRSPEPPAETPAATYGQTPSAPAFGQPPAPQDP